MTLEIGPLSFGIYACAYGWIWIALSSIPGISRTHFRIIQCLAGELKARCCQLRATTWKERKVVTFAMLVKLSSTWSTSLLVNCGRQTNTSTA